MAKDEDAKHRIITELEAARLGLARSTSIVKERLDLPTRISDSFRRHSWSWVSLAALAGWALARLPWRRTKSRLASSSRHRLKGAEKQTGRKWDLAWMVWDGLWG